MGGFLVNELSLQPDIAFIIRGVITGSIIDSSFIPNHYGYG